MKILCSICGRSGSSGVKNKNIKNFLGRSLISYTIDQAKKSKFFNKIIISSDSKKILDLGKIYNVDLLIKRPLKLANSTASKLKVIKHLFKYAERFYKTKFDLIVDLDITSPLRSFDDIKSTLRKIKSKKSAANVVCISNPKRNPYFNMVKLSGKKIKLVLGRKKTIHSRQTAPKVYDVNPSVIAWNRDGILKLKKVINKNTYYNFIPVDRSLDIDTSYDFELAELIYKHKVLK